MGLAPAPRYNQLRQLKRFVSRAAATAVTGTDAETETLAALIEPRRLEPGDRLKVVGNGLVTAHTSTHTLTASLYLQFGSGTAIKVAESTAVNPGAANIPFEVDAAIDLTAVDALSGRGAGVVGGANTVARLPVNVANTSTVDLLKQVRVSMRCKWSNNSASLSAIGHGLEIEICPAEV
jgi:hypothetical protein